MGVLIMSMSRQARLVSVAALALSLLLGATDMARADADESDRVEHTARQTLVLADEDDDASPSRRGWRPMRERELDDALALLEKVKPDLAERLEALRGEDPRQASRIIHQQFPRLRFLVRLKDADPRMYKLRVEDLRLTYQARELVSQYEQARDAADDELAGAVRDELSLLLEEHYDLRQRIRQHELEVLERRIAALREQIEARAAEREQVIDERLHELIGAESASR